MQASAQGTAPEISCQKMPVLRRNAQQKRADDTIKILQRLLNKFDFRLKVDGFFGAKTEAAVKEFQKRGNDHDPEFLAGLRQILSPNKAQSRFISEEYVPIVIQPLHLRGKTLLCETPLMPQERCLKV